ncbi:cell division protein ZapA [Thalassomonas viridans]|uniref:Cell division protein ZapA n=1 Tax=Thalassomonas viridans TaxID=137584 RepID=A0AAF0CAL0_9GAMM|nr:cell division protein ZapA [Thalassomonas viridans]WDE06631.1 cell division protein ZapA [Thalassomonas viridans]
MSPQTIEIKIADRRLKVACPQGQEAALLAAANELNARLEKTRTSPAVATLEQALLLTALNLSNDLLQSEQQREREQQQTREQIQLLQSTIKQALLEQKVEQKNDAQ